MSQVTADRVKEERPFRNVRFGPTDAVVERKPDGTVYIRSACALGDYPPTITGQRKCPTGCYLRSGTPTGHGKN